MPFELWRQDDNGHRFLVGRHPTLDDAERQLAELTRAHHKQSYWIIETGMDEDRK
ncbi:MAG: SPOR domain-containing protein [Desulfuromonas sp.]|nr:SPOR domain-containing protein [Desulfuromonas sp.]